jgi:signal transduction histidine kinase/ActR/RegA family two-component response regulator
VTTPAGDSLATRVLVLAPTAKDAEVTASLLTRAGIAVTICESAARLIDEISLGAGAVLMTEEALGAKGADELVRVLKQQSAWYKIPLVILMHEHSARTGAVRALENVTLLERPAAMRTVISSVQAALRERHRQYQIRDQFQEIERLLASEQAARAEVERASRAKDEFLAIISHELRTPLSAILLWTRMLQSGMLKTGDLDEAVAGIARSAEAQRQLIGDLLDMARMMTGKLRLDLRGADLGDVVRAAVDAIRPTASLKDVVLRTSIAGDIGTVRCDPERIQQVVWNLLSNALKFTRSRGHVDVTLAADGERAVITVKDDGQGIPAEFLPHVFDRFRQADGSITRHHGGLGLGLAIVRQLVELHGGTVRAQSEGEDRGATFVVELPRVAEEVAVNENANGRRQRYDDRPLSGLDVLLVEDEPETRRALSAVLESSGATVNAVANAAAAYERVRAGSPDVFISDIGLPGEDGYSLMRRIGDLSAERGTPRLPAMALTAYARSEDRDRALAAGFQAYAAKPIEPEDLVRAVATLGGRAQ